MRRAYISFLLRLWKDDDETPWRARLEEPHSGEHHTFAALVHLVRFLEEQTGENICDEKEVQNDH